MAVKNHSFADPTKHSTSRVVVATWASLANGDTGNDFSAPDLPDKTVTVSGTFGSGGSVSMQDAGGANLTDQNGDAVTFTAAGSKLIAENPEGMHPNVTAGDGTTDLTIKVVAVG